MSIKREILKHQLRSAHSFVNRCKRNYGEFTDETHKVWNRVGKLVRSSIESNWRRKGYSCDLDNPKSLAEKLEWLKLNYHDELYFEIVDKVEVRNYVKRTMDGDCGILNEIFALYDSVEDIETSKLPDKFVLKPSHWSGNIFIISADNPLSSQITSTLSYCLARRYGNLRSTAEWPYWSHHPRKVIAEKYLEDQYSQLVDYKWFCFHGVPKFVMVCKDRFVDHKRCFFDPDWNPLPFSDSRYQKFPSKEIAPPKSLEHMRTVARHLSHDFPFMRVDLYDINGICKFGELTPYPEAGIDCRFAPNDWDSRIGSWLELPEPKINRCLAYSRFVA